MDTDGFFLEWERIRGRPNTGRYPPFWLRFPFYSSPVNMPRFGGGSSLSSKGKAELSQSFEVFAKLLRLSSAFPTTESVIPPPSRTESSPFPTWMRCFCLIRRTAFPYLSLRLEFSGWRSLSIRWKAVSIQYESSHPSIVPIRSAIIPL